MLEADPMIKVVASVGNGQVAVQALDRHDVEVIVLDIEMPVMDGLTALPKLLEKRPNVRVIMSSTLTQQNAEISLKALELGATDYIPKPSSSRDLTGAGDFKTILVDKVKALGTSVRRGTGLHRDPQARSTARPFSAERRRAPAAAPSPAASFKPPAGAKPALRAEMRDQPDVIAIGSSTGGPQALFTVLGGLKKAGGVRQPILITQHMPATFTTILADHIARISGFPASEAKDGERIMGGHVYVAPGDYHMLVEVSGQEKFIKLDQGPPENFCRPSVDPMFRSISKAYGRKVLACVLTGMGADGAKGGQIVVDGGGAVVAQDEATSIVWGMPGAAASAGICSAILPISEVATYIHKIASRR